MSFLFRLFCCLILSGVLLTPIHFVFASSDKDVLVELAGYGKWWDKNSCVTPPINKSKTDWVGRLCEENVDVKECSLSQVDAQKEKISCVDRLASKYPSRWNFYTSVNFNSNHDLYRFLTPYPEVHYDHDGKVVPEVLNCPWIAKALHTEKFSDVVFSVDIKNRKFLFKNLTDQTYGEISIGLTVYRENKNGSRIVFSTVNGGGAYSLSANQKFTVDKSGIVSIK